MSADPRLDYSVGMLAANLLTVVAAGPLAALRDSAAAMACCAKTDYACAGMSAPDDCWARW